MKQKVDSYQYPCLNDAKEILRSIGMPNALYNPRCVMTLCACAEVFKSTDWKRASESYHGTHDIIALINSNFPNKAGLDKQGYQENSRETFRDETLKKWTSAGIMEAHLGLASNDKNNGFRFTAPFAALLHTYGTERWEDELAAYNSTHESYKEVLRQARSLNIGYPVTYEGMAFSLGRTPHNKLQLAVLEIFAKYFASGAELLYIGDTSDRKLWRRDQRLAELGIRVLSESTKLPDIILYDATNDRILFIEAYNSSGEFNYDRVKEISALCDRESGRQFAFVTAFSKTKTMLKVYSKIAWDTDIWVVEDPTHMTHKNGDKFLGRRL